MSPEITKRSQFLLEFVRQSLVRPDLAMWMWIARAHHLAAILENLNGGDPVPGAKFEILVSPRVDHAPNLRDTHACDRQAVIRQEAYDTADAALRLRDQKALLVRLKLLDIRLERSEIIVEDERALVYRVADSAGAGISRTKITIRIVVNGGGRRRFLHLTLPRTLRSMRRHEHPFPSEGVQTAMRLFG